MASKIQEKKLHEIYLNQGVVERSVVLHAWKEVGKWGEGDSSGKSKRGERTFVYLCAGMWGGLEIFGRGVASWVVGNPVSTGIVRRAIPLFASKSTALKAQNSYLKTKAFVEGSFDECVHGTSQCFQSVGANFLSHEGHMVQAKALKAFLGKNEVGMRIILAIESINPSLIFALLPGILFNRHEMTIFASINTFKGIVAPLIAQKLSIEPERVAMNFQKKIKTQKLALLYVKDSDLLSSVPLIFEEEDPFFKTYLCPITNKPIRFIKQVKLGDHVVSYEKEAIEKWFKENPKKIPSSWPKSVPYKVNALKDNLKIQLEINARMQKIIDKLQEKKSEIALSAIEILEA